MGERKGGKKGTYSKLAPMVYQPAVGRLISVVVATTKPCSTDKKLETTALPPISANSDTKNCREVLPTLRWNIKETN
jgi:hypothetical protein